MPKPPKWSAEENAILRSWWGIESPADIAARLALEAGASRTPSAVKNHARDFRISSRDQGYYSVAELAQELALGRAATLDLLRRFGMKPRKFGYRYILTPEQAEQITRYYHRGVMPERWITVKAAAGRLGYFPSHVSKLVQAGALRGAYWRRAWRVDLAHVEEIEADMRASGTVRRDWGIHLNATIYGKRFRALPVSRVALLRVATHLTESRPGVTSAPEIVTATGVRREQVCRALVSLAKSGYLRRGGLRCRVRLYVIAQPDGLWLFAARLRVATKRPRSGKRASA